jgi:nucleoside-diphosphate-sugar epimerase
MRVLVTGNNGYIGTVLTPLLRQAGHEVVGMDANLFERWRDPEHPNNL